MKCGLLTFYNAQNYGAVLQCLGLKRYLEKLGHNAEIIEYTADRVAREYAEPVLTRPFSVGKTFRLCQKRLRGVRQKKLFGQFIRSELQCNQKENRYYEQLYSLDAAICGSDQVWNDSITGETDAYYLCGDFHGLRKIAYAASFGKRQLSPYQKEHLEDLKSFHAISLREEDGRDEVRQAVGKDIPVVMDPVFLLSQQEWAEYAQKSHLHIEEPYILYYSLKKNTELDRVSEQLAKKTGYKLICIHPTAIKKAVAGEWRCDVGPYEFLWLIQHAQLVCSNSFHATAFSIQFQKKFFHIIVNTEESRVESLLTRLNAYQDCKDTINEVPALNFAYLEQINLMEHVENSKLFITDALK